MFNFSRPVWEEINLDNFENNIKEIKRVALNKEIIAVIKADGYGHGAIDLAAVLLENGVKRFAVSMLSEAMELINAGIDAKLIILGFSPPTVFKEIVENDIEQTIFNYEMAELLSKEALKAGKMAKIHIALDTGMGRIGYLPEEKSIDEIYRISLLPNLIMEGVFSHFSTSDEKDKEYTHYQLEKYNWFLNKLSQRGISFNTRHISNSAAIIDIPEAQFDAVRAGIILYGCYPSLEVDNKKINLKPVMTLKANIVHIKEVKEGEYISYGRRFKTNRKSIVGTISIGYADGYSRLLLNKAYVIIKGHLAPIVGSICMDQCMVDITDISGVAIGDEVIIIGEDNGLHFNAEDVARSIGTINYEVLCMISKRVPRVYIKDNTIINIRNYI